MLVELLSLHHEMVSVRQLLETKKHLVDISSWNAELTVKLEINWHI